MLVLDVLPVGIVLGVLVPEDGLEAVPVTVLPGPGKVSRPGFPKMTAKLAKRKASFFINFFLCPKPVLNKPATFSNLLPAACF